MSEETKDMPKVSSDMEAPKAHNYIEKLVAKLCPDGVEYVELGGVTVIKRGKSLTKKNTLPGNIPVIAGGRSPAYYHSTSNRQGPVIVVAGSGAYAGYVSYWESDIYASDAFSVKPKDSDLASIKYIYYFLSSKQNKLYRLQSGSGVPHVYPRDFNKLIIPFPPLEVQNAIVEILDKFTKLEAELEAELAARRAQYEYYRNSLFENLNGGGSEILGNLVKIKNGKSYKGFNSGDIPVYGSGGIMTYVDRSAYSGPSVLIPRKGSIGNIFYVDAPFWNVDTIFYTEINREQVTPKYLYHALQVQNLSELNTAGGVPSLTQTVLKRVRIPLPPLAEQERIVKILDKFDALVNDISSGLPAEIEARRKQYEYYCDRLLTFPRKPESAVEAMQR
ncbi:restriction endonuclease subunit S [Rothia dentocariosa]|uniref:restriction endonuclease subunit S n=1 Tax=Rothia dentocariosa TaxID=2047 RepID=UPI0006602D91|nr:restriction endonuclease subunit S [Rothia dentocariosa]